MKAIHISLLFVLLFSPAVAEIEYLFAPECLVGLHDLNRRFVIRESDKAKINQEFWCLSNEVDFIELLKWMQKEKKEEPIQIKRMAKELYNLDDEKLILKIKESLTKAKEPNQAL